MKYSLYLFLAFLAISCTSRRESEMMELKEVSIEQLQLILEGSKNELNKSGGKLMYMGNWDMWHKFYYTNWIQEENGEIKILPQQRFRCKNLRLLNHTDGKEFKELVLPNRIVSIETETRTIVIDCSLDYLKDLVDEDLKRLSEAEPDTGLNSEKRPAPQN
jgi:hypothetical protein